MVDENDTETLSMPLSDESDEGHDVALSPQETAVMTKGEPPQRCPVTGQFLPGNKGGGRPKGAKDKLNTQVIGTLEKLWASRGEEIMAELAATKPEVLVAMVSRLIPQQLAAEAITGEEAEKGEGNQEVTIRVVTQSQEPALPAREVEGELLPADNVTH